VTYVTPELKGRLRSYVRWVEPDAVDVLRYVEDLGIGVRLTSCAPRHQPVIALVDRMNAYRPGGGT
jgi:hypothetical protein